MREEKMSYVYVITDDPFNPNHPVDGVENIKIGFTSDKNIFNRVRQLQTGNPRPLRIVDVFEFKNNEMAKQIENLCHWNLTQFRLSGEWFKYEPRVMEVLCYVADLSNHYNGEKLKSFLAPFNEAPDVQG
jgi:hypothetical protein